MPETTKKPVIARSETTKQSSNKPGSPRSARDDNTAKLDTSIFFNVDVKNHELLKLAYESYLAEGRQVGAKTLRRGEVRGGGRKPWRQKGTGRARFGSSRNPIWRGGGVVFGPLGNENYTKKIAKNTKKVALRQALTLANQAGKITVADFKFDGKVKTAVKFLTTQKIADKRRILLIVDTKTPEILRSTNNLPNVEVLSAKYLTVYHILNADAIVITSKSLETITDWLKPTVIARSETTKQSSNKPGSPRFARDDSKEDK
ncbi:50S ribosomal protein L4 [Candidatus Saccharibacteria bacterium]|nr:50S ribosomal protein L4 [Candidatus Saccharibacteria bacterium]